MIHFSASYVCFRPRSLLSYRFTCCLPVSWSHVTEKNRWWKVLNNTGCNVGSLEMWRKSVIFASWLGKIQGSHDSVDYLFNPRRVKIFAVNIVVLDILLKERASNCLLRKICCGKIGTERNNSRDELAFFFEQRCG